MYLSKQSDFNMTVVSDEYHDLFVQLNHFILWNVKHFSVFLDVVNFSPVVLTISIYASHICYYYYHIGHLWPALADVAAFSWQLRALWSPLWPFETFWRILWWNHKQTDNQALSVLFLDMLACRSVYGRHMLKDLPSAGPMVHTKAQQA